MSTVEWNGDMIKRKLRALIAQRLHAVGEDLVQLAKAKCPVDTGELRDSITYRVDEAELKVYVGSSNYKAHLIESGTSHSKPEPYLRPALDEAAKVLRHDL